MTIRIQNLLVIPPIFLILGLAIGLLADRAAQEEILWGLEEESIALAVTVAEMTGSATLDRILAGDQAAAARLRSQLKAVAGYGRAESIVIYSRLQGSALMALHRDTLAVEMEQPLWDQYGRNLSSQSVLGAVGEWGPYRRALAAAAPITAPGGGPEARGVALVVIPAGRLSTLTAELRLNLMVMVLLVTGLGVAAALFLSMQIGRQVRELRSVGEQVAAGEYRAPVQVSGVKEVQDLSNTLGTMASILSDVFSRGRRALLVGDPFQLNRRIATAYRESREMERPQPGGVEVGVSYIGETPPGCFHGWAQKGDQIVFWVGEVSSGGPLDVAVAAATANRLIDRGIGRETPEDVSDSVSGLFELDSLQFATLDRPDGEPVCTSLQGTGEPVRKGDYSVIHSFQAEHMDSLVGSLSLFRDLSPAFASREIPLALPDTLAGLLLLIRPSRPNAQEVRS